MIKTTWINENIENIDDILLSFDLTQDESEAASFVIHLANTQKNLSDATTFDITKYFNQTLQIFVNTMSKTIHYSNENYAGYHLATGYCINAEIFLHHTELTFLCAPQNPLHQFSKLIETSYKENILIMNPLFYKTIQPHHFLEARNYLVEWDRATLTPKLCSFFSKTQADIDLSDSILEDHLALSSTPPIKSCTLVVEIKWQKTSFSEINIFERIRKSFSNQKITTLTHNAFEKSWPKTDKKIGKHYWVTRAFLCRDSYDEITIQREEAPSLKRTTYKGRLFFGFKERMHYTESLSLTLFQKKNAFNSTSQEEKTIFFSLDSTLDSFDFLKKENHFFESEQAKKLIDYILERGKALLKASNRNHEFTFFAPFLKAYTVSTFSTVKVTLFGKEIFGKVSSYSFSIKNNEGIAKITISFGDLIEELDIGLDALKPHLISEEVPKREEVIKNIRVINDSFAQEELLKQELLNQSKLPIDMMLLKNPTKIEIDLYDLKKDKQHKRHYSINLSI